MVPLQTLSQFSIGYFHRATCAPANPCAGARSLAKIKRFFNARTMPLSLSLDSLSRATAKPENMRRTSGLKAASASTTKACGSFGLDLLAGCEPAPALPLVDLRKLGPP